MWEKLYKKKRCLQSHKNNSWNFSAIWYHVEKIRIELKYSCKKCEYKVISKAKLQRHIKRQHKSVQVSHSRNIAIREDSAREDGNDSLKETINMYACIEKELKGQTEIPKESQKKKISQCTDDPKGLLTYFKSRISRHNRTKQKGAALSGAGAGSETKSV